MDETYFSFQDIMWRTVHGYAGLCGLKENYYDDEFLADLKSVCKDISKASSIGEFRGFTLLKKDAMPDYELQKIKKGYENVPYYLMKQETGNATHEDLNETIATVGTLMKYLKKSREAVNINRKILT
jgi:hypothetical protein